MITRTRLMRTIQDYWNGGAMCRKVRPVVDRSRPASKHEESVTGFSQGVYTGVVKTLAVLRPHRRWRLSSKVFFAQIKKIMSFANTTTTFVFAGSEGRWLRALSPKVELLMNTQNVVTTLMGKLPGMAFWDVQNWRCAMTDSSTTFRLDIPADVYDELTRIARRRGGTVEDLLRQAVKWEILLDAVEQQGGRLYIEREPGAELSMIVPDTKRVDQ